MGMMIDEYMAIKEQQACISKTIENLWNRAQQYEQLKADYENRLKADMVAMLEDVQYEASNICPTIRNCCSFSEGIMAYDKLIQQKINSLKESNNDKS